MFLECIGYFLGYLQKLDGDLGRDFRDQVSISGLPYFSKY